MSERTLPEISKASAMDRRQFLTVAGGLLLSFSLETGGGRAQAAAVASSNVTAFIRIGVDESVTVLVGGGEMGQGIFSGLAQGAAEELMVDWSVVKVESLPAVLAWLTGGSSGIARRLVTVRTAAAAARDMLIAAAAQTWNVATSALVANNGTVVNTLNNQYYTYGQLAALAATLPVPTAPTLTPQANWRILGKPVPRLDLPGKVNGSAKYGIDATVPGMVFAVIKHCPSLTGTLKSTPAVPAGALAVVPLDNAVAVVATNTWAAKNAAENLSVSWTIPAAASTIDSGIFATQAQTLMGSTTPYVAESAGDVAGGLGYAAKTIDVTYAFPYLAHSCMEVLNCTVNYTGTACEIWAPTQAPASVLATAATLTGLPKTSITVHPMLMGGGLGRKIEQDYISQAVRVAMAINKPVKLTWTREEDMSRDQYRPAAWVHVRAGVDSSGNVTAYAHRAVSPSISAQRGAVLPATGDGQGTEGATKRTYNIANRLIEYVQHPSVVPVGYWRSVGNSFNTFALESAIDELASAAGIDPLAIRQKLLANDPRGLAVLNAAAALGQWSTPPAAGHARGIAFGVAFNTYVAEVVEVSQPTAGAIKIHSVACVVDCGTAVNPDSVVAQMQGGIVHGLSAILFGQVTFKSGKASARNFSNYRALRMSECPQINVQIINSGAPFSGTGEPGVPPLGPALANAWARLTGTRIRSLPFFPGATMGEGGSAAGGSVSGGTATTGTTGTTSGTGTTGTTGTSGTTGGTGSSGTSGTTGGTGSTGSSGGTGGTGTSGKTTKIDN